MHRERHGAEDVLSDGDLVLAARKGAEWAKETLFRRYAPIMNGLAIRLMIDKFEVDDLVQDTFVQALDGLPRLKDPQAFAAWLKTILVRTAGKRMKRRRIRSKLGLCRDVELDYGAVVSPAAPPDVVAELRTVYSSLNLLPAECRIALTLKRIEGLGLDDIAEMMGLSVATVKRRIRTADRLMKDDQRKRRKP